MSTSVLIIEDESNIADAVLFALKKADMKGTWCQTGVSGLSILSKQAISLVILDVGLPDTNGFDWLKALRQSDAPFTNVPVIMLTARDEEIDRVVGLEIGADDYVTKPFSPRELVARVKTVLKRIEPQTAAKDIQHDFDIDSARHRISLLGEPLPLTRAEFLLLEQLLSQPNRVFSRQQLIEAIWSETHPSSERTIDTHIKTLRAKLKAVAPEQEFIMTHRGIGYALTLG